MLRDFEPRLHVTSRVCAGEFDLLGELILEFPQGEQLEDGDWCPLTVRLTDRLTDEVPRVSDKLAA